MNWGGAEHGIVGLRLGGMATVRPWEADWCPGDACEGDPDDASGDLLVQYDLEDFGDPSLRSASLDAHINGFPGEGEINFYDNFARLSVATQRWLISIDKTANPNFFLNFDELEDIELRVRWSYGRPAPYVCPE